MTQEVAIQLRISNIKRLTIGWWYTIGISALLLLTADVYNYVNDVWSQFPSQYYVLISHLLTIPVLGIINVANIWFIKNHYYYSRSHYLLLIFFNIWAFMPITINYYYWDLKDYSSSGIFLIYIFLMNFMLRLEKNLNISFYFVLIFIYFSILHYLSISYVDNPSLYLNGVAGIILSFSFNRVLYKLELDVLAQRHKNEEQTRKIKEINAKLQEEKKIVEEKNLILDEANKNLKNFAYIAAHDIKAPLRTISSYSTILKRKYKDVISESDLDLQNFVISGCIELRHIVDGLLHLSELSSRRIFTFPLNLNDVLKGTIQLLDTEINSNEARVVVQKEIPMIYGTDELLKELFFNLIGNALKFRRPNVAPKIEINWTMNEGEVIVEVKDNGIGISNDIKEFIFLPFKRGHSGEEFEGHGIGLGISKKILERLGGEIWVESMTGVGTSFFLSFTLVEQIEDFLTHTE